MNKRIVNDNMIRCSKCGQRLGTDQMMCPICKTVFDGDDMTEKEDRPVKFYPKEGMSSRKELDDYFDELVKEVKEKSDPEMLKRFSSDDELRAFLIKGVLTWVAIKFLVGGALLVLAIALACNLIA